MSFSFLAASVYALASLFAVGFQIAMAFGKPWGDYAMGGRFPGQWPLNLRVAALFQAIILSSLAVLVVEHARTARMGRAIWISVAVAAVALFLNTITPSPKEWRLWQPVTLVMLLSSLAVALLAEN